MYLESWREKRKLRCQWQSLLPAQSRRVQAAERRVVRDLVLPGRGLVCPMTSCPDRSETKELSCYGIIFIGCRTERSSFPVNQQVRLVACNTATHCLLLNSTKVEEEDQSTCEPMDGSLITARLIPNGISSTPVTPCATSSALENMPQSRPAIRNDLRLKNGNEQLTRAELKRTRKEAGVHE
jgi:hypothetical protein